MVQVASLAAAQVFFAEPVVHNLAAALIFFARSRLIPRDNADDDPATANTHRR
jgi:hypothetical protein